MSEPNTPEDIQGRKYPGYGRCIYCGSDGGTDGLRDEHIIPFSLHGNAEIKNASCTTCEKKINPADTHMAHAVFGNFRIHAGVQTRNPKDRPTVLPARFKIGEEEISRDLPIEDHPYSMALPVWGAAGFIRCAPIDEPFPETYLNIYHYTPPLLNERLGVPKEENIQIQAAGRVDSALFARSIAKIGYCHAVLRFGLDGFRPLLLPKIILGECPAVSYFVGSPLLNPPPPFPNKMLHLIQHADLVSVSGRLKLYVIHIRLFANSAHKNHGLPIYHVIVGAPKYLSAIRASPRS